jgi:hypothetical protein
LLERQVQVFQLLLGRRGGDGPAQRVGELALLVNRFQHGRAPVFQLAQVGEAVFEFAQLDVVQPAGGFLAVAGDEGHGSAAVKQRHGGLNLVHRHSNFLRDLRDDFLHGEKKAPHGAGWE